MQAVRGAEQGLAAAEERAAAAQQALRRAREELEKRITEHDTCVEEKKPEELVRVTLDQVGAAWCCCASCCCFRFAVVRVPCDLTKRGVVQGHMRTAQRFVTTLQVLDGVPAHRRSTPRRRLWRRLGSARRRRRRRWTAPA